MTATRQRPLFLAASVFALAILFVPSALSTRRLNDQPDGSLLLERAAANDLRTDPVHTFHLHAKLLVWNNGTKPIEGTYEVYWLGRENRSEIIVMPGYQRVEVWGRDKMWQSRSIPYEPVRFVQLQHMLSGFHADLRLDSDDTIVNVSERNDKGSRRTCISIHPAYGPDREMCIDPTSADLLSESISGDDDEVREFSDYRVFADKRYPALIRLTYHNRPAVELRVDQISPLPQNATLKPPDGAEVWESCESARAARRIDKTVPDYPSLARREIQSGTVALYGVIEEDGSLSHLKVVESAFPMLNDAALAAARKFRFEPATCGGKPIRIENQFEVRFKLGQ